MVKTVKSDKTSTPKRKAVVVLGMHRSGTSAIAGVLERLGCVSPASQISKGDQNPRGFYESRIIARHNDKVLDSAGSNWHDWRPLNPGWIDSAPIQTLASQAVTILKEEFGDAPLIVLKDPRICRLVDYWALVLEMAGYEPHFINVHRNPIEVANSLEKRNQFDTSFSMLLWLRHIVEAEAATRGKARYFTSFDRLLQNWSGVFTQAQEAIELKFPRFSDMTAVKVDEFLTSELRHHQAPSEQVISNPMISDWIRNAYEILERWVRNGAEDNVDYANLDRLRAHFDAATPAFSRFSLAGEGAIKDLRDARAETKNATEQLRITIQDLAESENQLLIARSERDDLKAQQDQFESSLRQREAELQDVRNELIQAQQRAADTQELEALQQQLAELAPVKEDLKNRLRELGELAKMLSDAQAQKDAAKRKHAEEAAAHQAQIKKLKTEIDAMNVNLNKRKAEVAKTAALAREAWDEHEAIINSTSWRMTGPLRRIVDAFRGN